MSLWRTRIIAKRMLSRLPIGYRLWANTRFIFRHGKADTWQYILPVVEKHVKYFRDHSQSNAPWTALELGPGDGILSGFFAQSMGAIRVTLVDAGDFANRNVDAYHSQLDGARQAWPDLALPDISGCSTLDDLLSIAGSTYLTNGLESLKSLPSDSIDFIWSQAVLEHIRRQEFNETMGELRRILKPEGIMSHTVDFKDHLGGALNNLRISSSKWERPSYALRSGFYTNRLRHSEMVSMIASHDFTMEFPYVRKWGSSPIKRKQLAPEFSDLSDDDLCISGIHIVAKPKSSCQVNLQRGS